MMMMMMLGPQHPPLHLNEGEAMESEVRIEKEEEEEETNRCPCLALEFF